MIEPPDTPPEERCPICHETEDDCIGHGDSEPDTDMMLDSLNEGV